MLKYVCNFKQNKQINDDLNKVHLPVNNFMESQRNSNIKGQLKQQDTPMTNNQGLANITSFQINNIQGKKNEDLNLNLEKRKSPSIFQKQINELTQVQEINFNQTEIGYSNNTTQREALINQQGLSNSNYSSLLTAIKSKSNTKDTYQQNFSNYNLKDQKNKNSNYLIKNEQYDLVKETNQDDYQKSDLNYQTNIDDIQINQLKLFENYFYDSQAIQQNYQQIQENQKASNASKIGETNQDIEIQQQNSQNNPLGKEIANEESAKIIESNLSNIQIQICEELENKIQFHQQNDYNQLQVSANFQNHNFPEGKLETSIKNSVRDFDAIIRSKNISFNPQKMHLEEPEKQFIYTFEDQKSNSSCIYSGIQTKVDEETQKQQNMNKKGNSLQKIKLNGQQKETQKAIDISQSLLQDILLQNNYSFFKEILDFLDSSLFVIDENMQIIYSNYQASSLSEKLFSSFGSKKSIIANYQKKQSRNSYDNTSLNNQFFNDQKLPYMDQGQAPQLHPQKIQQISNQNLQDQQQNQKQFLEKKEQTNQNSLQKSLFQFNQVQSKQIIESQRNLFFTQNNIQSKDKLSFNKIQFEKGQNNQATNSNQEFKYNLLKQITVFEFSKQSLEHLKKMGINQNYSSLNQSNIQKTFQEEKMNISSVKNQYSTQQSNTQFQNIKFNPVQSTQAQIFNKSQKLDCSYLLDEVLQKESKRSERAININLLDLIKVILQNLNLEFQQVILEPVGVKLNEDLDILNNFSIKLIGKIINNQKCVIIMFSDIQEKELQLNKILERNIFQTISHELGTYTNFIQTFTQTALLDHSVPVSVKDNYLKYMNSNIFLVSQVIQDIRDYYEYQNDALKIIWKEINLIDLIRNICKHFKKLAKIKQITFKCDFFDIPEKICTDEQKTQSILINLLSNAFKFSQKNGQVTVEISYKKEDELIKISVKDSGIGMSFDEQQKLKLLLDGKSIQDKVSLNSSGFGFGLTISSILARKISKRNQNNNIKFISKQNQGSTFWFYLDAVSMIKKMNSKSLLNFQPKINSVLTQQNLQQSFINHYKSSDVQPIFDQCVQKELDFNSLNQQTRSLQKETSFLNSNAASIHTYEESQIQTQINSQNQIILTSCVNNPSNQILVGSSLLIKNGSKNMINPIPQIKMQQSKFKQQQQIQQNKFYNQTSLSNNPKILQKYIIISDNEIIEMEESDIFDGQHIFQEGITQSQSFDLKGQIEYIKQTKCRQNSCENYESNVRNEITQKQSCKNIGTKSVSKYNNSITQSFTFVISSNELKKKQKEELKVVNKRQSLQHHKSTSLKSLQINKSIENTSEQISFIDITPIESVQVQLPKQINNKFFSANKIMIVDDEPMNIKGLQIMLKIKADIQDELIYTATNGIEAVDLFKKSLSSLNQIKLIFMDINMPLLDGIEATKQIRELENRFQNQRHINICAYTCWTDLQTKIKCSQAGMDNYFSKPITHDQLFVALNRYYFNQ
ncbi:ATPase, histidine kinase-, DNA gyrase B (macronuclear) [Tetrahymena thermophila SB210]|uniref:histidine kinase n=1 Tax=Tetrahymena thermophila (strain SB210) TaxID=312017 RepID=I7M0S3_TETTS|nr:ATPase, histidine kinase-, DNA gyrase B [Tetrahymena thermophila SB210]EAR90841.2 ATPase, histidine kinase-, DNA gyrase B [Tetrahymena thermophila SB210]|eukprot:XP_001011086.2 ATPase, histidine kinase-, DNA gyrase B [Tetrahymena thermophila SB210]